MAQFMKVFVNSGAELDSEERDLLSIAYKNIVGNVICSEFNNQLF